MVPVTATYPEFVSFVQKFLTDYNNAEHSRTIESRNQAKKDKVITNMKEEYVEYRLSCGHLFDRLITEYVITEAAKSSDSGSNNGSDSISELHQFEDVTVTDKQKQGKQQGEVNVVDKAISVVYMLVVLNMAVKSNAEERVETLFKTAQMITKMKETSHNMAGIGGGNDNERMDIGVNEGKVDEQSSGSFMQNGEGEGVVENKDNNSMEEYISVDSAHRIVDHLIQSWQVGIIFTIE